MTATAASAVGQLNLKVAQGATFNLPMTWTDENDVQQNLTSWTGQMQVRATVEDPTIILELTTANGGIVLGANGSVVINITAVQTSALPPGNAVYDLELTDPSGVVTRLIEGCFLVDPEVTR